MNYFGSPRTGTIGGFDCTNEDNFYSAGVVEQNVNDIDLFRLVESLIQFIVKYVGD